MEWECSAAERARLRELAARQAEYAALPVMAERERQWRALNDGIRGARPPVVVETWTFDRDFLPASVHECTSETGRSIETQLLRNVRDHELIDDDKVVPATFDASWFLDIDEMGVRLGREEIPDAMGVPTGFRYVEPIKDLERDLPLLRPALCRVDRARTAAWIALLDDLFGDLLPIRLGHPWFEPPMLTHRVVELMGMETFFVAMSEQPDAVHRLMAFLRDTALRIMRWSEAEGLLTLNNANQECFGSSYGFTSLLPAPGFTPDRVRLADLWGFTNSQETVGVSPAMFREFVLPYLRDVVEPFGLLYYGCCEPVHGLWEEIRRLPHLKKVSVSPWCDQRFMGEALRGSDIVFSRKPAPTFLGLAERLDEEAWAAHIRETAEAASGAFLEVICRDVYTVHGDLDKPRRAVEIARRELEQSYVP